MYVCDQRHEYGEYLAKECQGPGGYEDSNEPKPEISRDFREAGVFKLTTKYAKNSMDSTQITA